MKKEQCENYYDINNTIAVGLATDPRDEDNPAYNREAVFESLQRNAPRLYVANDSTTQAPATIFVCASHMGGQHFSRERPIYSGEIKEYKNIYELRIRSATKDTPYRVTEYKIFSLR